MSAAIRPATPGECDRLWPAVASGNVFDSREEFRAYHAEAPWRVRVTDKGEAAVLGAWRRHLDLLAMKGVWCSPRRVKAFVEDARGVARAQGFDGVISPLLPELFLEPYQRAGMRIVQRVVAMRGSAGCDALPSMPAGVHLRVGSPADAAALAELDAECFSEMWSWGAEDLLGFMRTERLGLAEADDGELIGYTLATVSGDAATLTRLATGPRYRRMGVGRALLAEASAWASRAGARTISLCTQEENLTARSLYRSAGLTELDERYAFALADAREKDRR